MVISVMRFNHENPYHAAFRAAVAVGDSLKGYIYRVEPDAWIVGSRKGDTVHIVDYGEPVGQKNL